MAKSSPRRLQREVIAAFDAAFDATHLMLRYPIMARTPSGFIRLLCVFHWVMCPGSFTRNSSKLVRMSDGEEVPIGGEVYPELQSSPSPTISSSTPTANFFCAVSKNPCVLDDQSRRLSSRRRLRRSPTRRSTGCCTRHGPRACCQPNRFPARARDGLVDVTEVVLSNTGVAPFYYPLALQLEDESGNRWELATDLQSLQLGRERTLELNRTNVLVHHLSETYSLRLKSPILLGDQVIRFADRDPKARSPSNPIWLHR